MLNLVYNKHFFDIMDFEAFCKHCQSKSVKVKGGISQCYMQPFASSFVAFRNAKCHESHYKQIWLKNREMALHAKRQHINLHIRRFILPLQTKNKHCRQHDTYNSQEGTGSSFQAFRQPLGYQFVTTNDKT